MAVGLRNRAMKEFYDLQKNKDKSVQVKLLDNNYHQQKGGIKRPIDTCYQGGIFDVDIIIPDEYPFKPPKMKFDKKYASKYQFCNWNNLFRYFQK